MPFLIDSTMEPICMAGIATALAQNGPMLIDTRSSPSHFRGRLYVMRRSLAADVP